MIIIVRNGPPNSYDHYPQNTVCKVALNERDHERYIQRSSDEENPEWDYVGVFNNDEE